MLLETEIHILLKITILFCDLYIVLYPLKMTGIDQQSGHQSLFQNLGRPSPKVMKPLF